MLFVQDIRAMYLLASLKEGVSLRMLFLPVDPNLSGYAYRYDSHAVPPSVSTASHGAIQH